MEVSIMPWAALISKAKILVVDDAQTDYIFTRELLLKISPLFEIQWISRAAEFADRIQTGEFDVCLLDYRLDTCTAMELLSAAQNMHLDTAYIVFTGVKKPDSDNEVIRTGASDYLVKDELTVDNLERAIRYAIHRRAAEKKLAAIMREKELLLKELEHRVKNNLQMISSLLSLQAHSSPNEQVRSVFLDAQNRLQTMALLHEKLYLKSENLDQIDFQEYARDLVRLLQQAYLADSRDVKFDITLEQRFLNLSRAVPCGLIIHELLSNSMKHAFDESRTEKKIIVRLKKYGSALILVVGDNGKGVTTPIRDTSFGLSIIRLLAKQIQGKIKYFRRKGVTACLRFPE
jgi:two-component sensor histidine kinase